MENTPDNLTLSIAARLKAIRTERGLTLDQLADVSGVSRAMISRIERAEASPTATLLARLCSALGQSLSVFFAEPDHGSPLMRRADQPVWRDPETGYLRRAVSAPGTGARVDVVEVELPPGALVQFSAQPASLHPNGRQWQHVWLFEGSIELTVGDTLHRLEPGDCLYMAIGEVHSFHNPTNHPARYGVIIDLGR
ncbi:helix-turn-helix domain-containing protein [Agrobacterium vitis]|uniref:helix-turn-helix domain-containing protein n=1 Tax=Agrobacterium vitis TaxID=373 RepID=UPI0012E8F6A1|nr:XRE family transcriptional regulator [Agrobacterium vitis]MCF1452105.1 helix-turn-helix domain-containing protein [Agrobacterium vitis]MVA81021.1 helix-turn-helix domain-containing protein [Agrobacterium vitis]